MTEQDLVEHGFKESGPSNHDQWDALFQKKITDEYGTRYFINVHRWDHHKHGNNDLTGWEVEVTYNDGVAFNPGRAAVQVKAWAGVETWTARHVLKWAELLWARLKPYHYERDE